MMYLYKGTNTLDNVFKFLEYYHIIITYLQRFIRKTNFILNLLRNYRRELGITYSKSLSNSHPKKVIFSCNIYYYCCKYVQTICILFIILEFG